MGFDLVQDGDYEKTLIFTTNRFDEIAEIVQPYVRRHLSDEQRQNAVERLAAYRANASEGAEAQTAIQMPIGVSQAANLNYGP